MPTSARGANKWKIVVSTSSMISILDSPGGLSLHRLSHPFVGADAHIRPISRFHIGAMRDDVASSPTQAIVPVCIDILPDLFCYRKW